jgi:DNA-binding response OmpR family regulator
MLSGMTSTANTTATILVVDDDALISDVLGMALESHGYVVVTPTGVSEINVAAHDVQLVILDAHIPGVSFEQTMELLRERAIPVLVISGDTEPPANVSRSQFLHKPIELDDLLHQVQHMLSGTTQ